MSCSLVAVGRVLELLNCVGGPLADIGELGSLETRQPSPATASRPEALQIDDNAAAPVSLSATASALAQKVDADGY